MILSSLAEADRYASLHPLFGRALATLRDIDWQAREPGVHPIDADRLFAIVEETQGRARADARLECHRRYIDIQYVLEGVDEMGWRPLVDCLEPATEYDPARDIRFFNDAPAAWVATPAGSFCLFYPTDAHAPLVSPGLIRKVVLKIAV